MSLKRNLQIIAFFVFFGFVGATLMPRLFITKANADNQNSVKIADVPNKLPEIADLRHDKIGLGQRFFFGLEVIDEEGDNVRIELIEKPKSAKFNQNTLTVDWTPQKSDGKVGKFVVKVTEIPRDKSREPRTVTKEYKIKIVKKPIKLLELPPAPLKLMHLLRSLILTD